MKGKISYLITIGSRWPAGSEHPKKMSDVRLPEGGTFTDVEIEYDSEDVTETGPLALVHLTDKLLDAYMLANHPGESYHIWYWYWL